METKRNWHEDEFHPSQQCFFCKKRAAVTHDHEELYKVIRNTTGFPGYVVNYTTACIPIPVCAKCSARHHKQEKQLGVIKFIAWIIATGVICYWVYDPADGLFICLILSMLIAIPLSFILLLVLGIIWSLCSKKTDEVASKGDYPVVRKLQSIGWQWKLPKAKYGDRKNVDIDQDTIRRLNVDHLAEAKNVTLDFLVWCKAKEGQNN